MGRRGLFRRIRKSEWGRRVTVDLACFGIQRLVRSLKMIWIDRNHIEHLYETNQPFIFAYWHSDLILACRIGIEELARRKIVVITSTSRDGQIVGENLARQGMEVVWGSSRRGGVEAFLNMAKQLRSGLNGSIAVDGPRGPRREVKEGVIRLAQITGHAIIPCAIGYKRCVTFSSWDRLRIPFPFTETSVICGEPQFVDAGIDRRNLAEPTSRLAQALVDLRQRLPYDRD
jgi:lysophospholipid acyltransferase (LPLAT)-like uncharacterized protein